MNKFSSIFGKLLSLFPRLEFESLVKKPKPPATPKAFPAGISTPEAYLSLA